MQEKIQKKYARAKTIAKMLDIGLSTLWTMVKENRLPKPVKLSPRVTLWDVDEVLAFVSSQNVKKEVQL